MARLLIVTLLSQSTRTSRYLEQKSIFPGFPSYIYCNFTLGNSNLPLIQRNFRFPSGHFLYNFTLDNSNHVCQYVTSQNKQYTVVQNIKFILKQPCELVPFFYITQNVSILSSGSAHFYEVLHEKKNIKHRFFLLSAHLFSTSDNVNLFHFPLKVRVIRSRL